MISQVNERFDGRPAFHNSVKGILFGSAAVVGMASPLELGPGLIFDARTLFIGVGSAFGGIAVAVISGAIAIAYRLSLGGAGALAGSVVILTSALIGAGFFWLRKRNIVASRTVNFLLFGLVLHAVALPWYFLVPGEEFNEFSRTVGIAMLVTFTPATALLCVLFSDIEARASMREALKARDADFNRILSSMKNMYYRSDANGLLVRVSPSVTNLLGYTPEEIIGRDASDIFYTPPDRMAFLAALDAGNGTVRDYEVALRAKDGRKVMISTSSHYLYDARGMFSGVEGIGRDFSDRKEAEEQVHTLVERLSLATRAGEIGIWDRDVASGMIVWDGRMCELFGLPGDGYTGTPEIWTDIVHPEDIARLRREIDEAIATKNEFSTTFRLILPDGTIRHLESYGLVNRNAAGEAVRLIGINRDITAKVESEQRLIESQKMEMVGQLTGGIAHDFNNLLAVILGNLEFMDDHIAAGTTLGALKEGALRATLRGADLTQRLLAFSRKQALRPEYTDTGRLIQELSELMRRSLGDHVEIECCLSTDVSRIVIDPGQLENALLNLAINARDAMPDGGKITIATENALIGPEDPKCANGLTPGSYVVITVSDTGSGMSSDVRARVFEPFFTTKEAGKGSGLGMSMVYGFVKQSDGHVTIDSTPGNGTVIRLYLPQTDQVPRQQPSASEAVGFQPRGTENVLVVENDPDVRGNLTATLEMLGYRVASASDGPSAIAMLDDLPPLDLLITDLVMPHGMNGEDVAANVRKRYRNVRILYTSGIAGNTVGTPDSGDDGIAFLPKPYRRTVLAQTIRQLLDAA
ncbi:MAG: PAS domain-containing protein [Alphaproteobacteria bacterium]